MCDEDIITHIFVCIDDIITELSIDPHPGPVGQLSLSEVLTLMVLQPILKPFSTLQDFHRWMAANWRTLFPWMPDYTWLTRLFNNATEFLVVVLQRLANMRSFGLVADGTALPVMHVRRGPWAKSFREGRKVYCASKNEWFWGFLLELVIDQAGYVAFFTVSVEAEIRQLMNILENLCDRWVLADKGNRGKTQHQWLWDEKQIRIKITQSKERTWIENVIGFAKSKLGLDRIRVRTHKSLMSRLTAILCAYNLYLALNLPI
jgi:hypothetical protein